jgi:hypothetical protein
MPSVVSQAVAMQRTPEITAVGLGGSFSPEIPGPFTTTLQASGTFSLNQNSEPYQKIVVMTQISKGFGLIIDSLSVSISGTPGILLAEVSNSTTNLYMHFCNTPRTNAFLGSTFYSITLTGPSQTPGTINSIIGRVYLLDGGSGPYDVQTTGSSSHVLGENDFINDKAAIFAISTGSSITGITTQATQPVTGGQIFTSGSTINLSGQSLMISAAFK